MILVTHAVAGAALSTLVPNHPVEAFAIGFVSHFLLDAIPHWHYPVSAFQIDNKNMMNSDMVVTKHVYSDALKIGLDIALGFGLSFIFIHKYLGFPVVSVLFGALGGIVPDAIQFVYFRWRHEPIKSLQKFHIWIHSKTNIDHKHVSGIAWQILIISISIYLVRFFL